MTIEQITSTPAQFRRHLKRASAIRKSWPAWKRKTLATRIKGEKQ